MKFFDYIRLALKNLWRQKSRTFLTIFAIFIGAISVISMIALVLGAKNAFNQQLNASGALTQVGVVANKDATADDINRGNGGQSTDGTKLDDALITKIKAVPNVVAVSPFLYVNQLQSYTLKDDPTQKKHSFQNVMSYEPGPAVSQEFEAGRDFLPTDKQAVIMPDKVLSELGYKNNAAGLIGKTLIFTTQPGFSGEGAVVTPPPTQAPGDNRPPNNNQQPQNTTDLEAVVVGVTAPGGDDNASIPLSWAKGLMTSQMYQQDQVAQKAYQEAQSKFQGPNGHPIGTPPTPPPMILVTQSQLDQMGYQSLKVKVDTVDHVEGVAAQIRGFNVGAATAKSVIDEQLKIFNLMGLVLGAIGAISLFVAAIGVINTMIMATLERTREIGVMRACGATRSAVSRLFTFEAASLGFWGGMVGIGFGYIAAIVGNIFVNRYMANQHIALTNIIVIPWWLAVGVVAATTVVGILAGLYPAFRAARLNPVDALRYE